MRTVVHPQLDGDLADDLSKIPAHIYSCIL